MNGALRVTVVGVIGESPAAPDTNVANNMTTAILQAGAGGSATPAASRSLRGRGAHA